MQVSVENTGNLERRMTVSIPADRLSSVIDNRLRDMASKANLKGFRKGKVPTKVIEQRFGQQVRSEAFGELVRASFDQAVRQENVRIAGDDAVVEHLVARLHGQGGRPLLASYPRELLGRICDFASFSGITPRLTIPALEQAWISMFAGCASGHAAPALPPAPFHSYGSDPLLERTS